MRNNAFALLVLSLCSCSLLAQAAGVVSFEHDHGALDILVDGEHIATYIWYDDALPRPYFCNVNAPDSTRVTRNHPPDPVQDKGNSDHATYHPGVWLAFGDVNGADFWRNDARIKHVGFPQPPQGGEGMGSFQVINQYERTGASPETICEERCTYSIHVTAHGYLILSQSEFRSDDTSIVFGDQEEMGLGVRLATGLTVRHGKGSILNSNDGIDEKGTWGKQAAWCAGFKKQEDTWIGMMIMPNPASFRTSWFHSRDYGLIVANPFGKKAMTGPDDKSVRPDTTTVKPGETLEVGFGVYVFSLPDSESPDLRPLYADYLARLGGAAASTQ